MIYRQISLRLDQYNILSFIAITKDYREQTDFSEKIKIPALKLIVSLTTALLQIIKGIELSEPNKLNKPNKLK